MGCSWGAERRVGEGVFQRREPTTGPGRSPGRARKLKATLQVAYRFEPRTGLAKALKSTNSGSACRRAPNCHKSFFRHAWRRTERRWCQQNDRGRRTRRGSERVRGGDCVSQGGRGQIRVRSRTRSTPTVGEGSRESGCRSRSLGNRCVGTFSSKRANSSGENGRRTRRRSIAGFWADRWAKRSSLFRRSRTSHRENILIAVPAGDLIRLRFGGRIEPLVSRFISLCNNLLDPGHRLALVAYRQLSLRIGQRQWFTGNWSFTALGRQATAFSAARYGKCLT